jgi:N-acetylneuraminate synthase
MLQIGNNMKTYIIAEIGINHNGDINIAKQLIDVAKVAGVDCVKFQKRNPDICVPDHQKSVMKTTPWGTMTYLEYRHRVEFNKAQYDEIAKYSKDRAIQWSSSVWDLDSLAFLKKYDLPFIKIPSAKLTDDELLQATIETGKKVILSTGMSTLKEIAHAVKLLKADGNANFALLHCNSSYPAPLHELNLSGIITLKKKFKCEVGYSGHEFRMGSNVHTVSTVYLGATIIERHITLDRTMWGTDQSCSVEPEDLIKMVRGIRELEVSFGDGEIYVSESEKPIRKKLRG